EFSTIIDVQAGKGIAVTQIGGIHTVCVQLGSGSGSTSSCGLSVSNNGLCVNPSIAGCGLSWCSAGNGCINVNTAAGGSAASLPIRLYNNCLVLNCLDINNEMPAITGATNGLTEIANCF